jgi:hypothetical protein
LMIDFIDGVSINKPLSLIIIDAIILWIEGGQGILNFLKQSNDLLIFDSLFQLLSIP